MFRQHVIFMGIISIFFLSLFLIVLIADYKTWIDIFIEPLRLRKFRKNLAKEKENDNL